MNCEITQQIFYGGKYAKKSVIPEDVNIERAKIKQNFTYLGIDFLIDSLNDYILIEKEFGKICINLSDFLLRLYTSDCFYQYNTYQDENAIDLLKGLVKLLKEGKIYTEFVVTDLKLGVFIYSNFIFQPNNSGFLDVTNHFYITRQIDNSFYTYSVLFDRIIPRDEMVQSETGNMYIRMIKSIVNHYTKYYKSYLL